MSDNIKKLFLLDGMALIFRAHYAFIKNPRITSKGMNTSAVFGFTNTLLDVLKNEKPTHIAIALDTAAPTFRHEAFVEYKAQREAPPEDIIIAIPYIEKLADAFNIPVLKLDGFEADDIIGTIAKKSEKEGFETYMMTPDKDYCQLVSEKIKIYKPAYMGKPAEVIGIKEVLEKWSISSVDQVVDILGLQGDAVDNIPGIPGVGEKTAQKLIAEFGSVENLIQNAEKLSGKQKENVIKYAQQAILSKQLAVIKIDVPVEFDEKSLLKEDFNAEKIMALFDELEFKTLTKRLFGEQTSASENQSKSKPKNSAQTDLFGSNTAKEEKPTEISSELKLETFQSSAKNINNTKHNYYLIDTPEKRKSLIHYLSIQEEFCFDTETTDINSFEAQIVGLSFAYIEHEAYYVPLPENQTEALQIMNKFKPVFENENIKKIGQNIKFDAHVLKNYNINLKGKCFDTMLAHYLLESEQKHNMDFLAKKYLNYEPVSIEELIGKKGKNQGSMRNVETELIKEYAAEDADVTLCIKHKISKELDANSALKKLFEDVEVPLTEVLLEMERNGVAIDVQFLKDYSASLTEESQKVEKSIYDLAGVVFNIASPKQLGDILFEKLNLDPKAKKTKTGQYATNEEVLVSLSDKHKIISKILDYRELNKLRSTYVDALPQLVSEKDNLLHTSFNQTIAATGRLSSVNPNLQNIPIRTERGKEIRKAFVPRKNDNVILSADYSQIELRIMAHFSEDHSMIEAFKNNEDIHKSTAAKVFNVSLSEVTDDMRRKAKMVNFGIIYGISSFGLAQRLNISRTEASEIIKTYFEKFNRIKAYMDECIQKAHKEEFTETILGRRRYLRDINSNNHSIRSFAERNAINTPIQGSAADLIKIAMMQIHEWLKKENLSCKMILQVHDELIFDCPANEVEKVSAEVKNLMENAMSLRVPLRADFGYGKNWLEAH